MFLSSPVSRRRRGDAIKTIDSSSVSSREHAGVDVDPPDPRHQPGPSHDRGQCGAPGRHS